MKKLKDILKESNVQIGKVYSNPYATAFVKENEEQEEPQMELSEEQKKAFLESVKQYKKYGESVYRNAGLGEVYESIKNMVEMAGKVTLSETDDWFDNVTVSRHMKRMGESFKVFEKTLKEVSTLQQRLEASYDEIGEVLGKYYEISEELDPVGKEDGDIDNDGDEDASDEYLANRRKVISKAIKKESMNLTDILKEGKDVGHYERVGNQTIVDSNFVNYSKGVLPNSELVHLGMGDFAIKSQSGMIKFQRSGKMDGIGQDFVGRPHRMTDDKNGKLVDMFLKLMLKKKKAILSMSESVNEDMAGWIAIDHKGNKLEIKKSEAKDLYNAKLLAIKKLKVPKSKVGMLAIKPAVSEAVVNEAKYDIGMARKGNGITVYNRAEEEKGDYKNVAHISDNGVVKYYDKNLPSNIKKKIEAEAKKMKESVNEETKMIKLKNLLNESFGMGELPSDKLMKMKVSAKDMLESVGEDDVNEARVSAKKLLQSVVDGETKEVEGIKLSKEMAEAYLNWLRMSPFGKKYGKLPFNKLFKASFRWGLHRHADEKSKEYKDLKVKAKGLDKK